MSRSGLTFIVVACILLTSCINKRDKEAETSTIYFDYMVTGEEESNRIVTKIQYRIGGRNGDAIRLDTPAAVIMDGVTVMPDSTEFNGVYYEVISEAQGFAGRHNIEFRDAAGKIYPVEFDFPVFSIKNELPEVIGRRDLVIELAGLSAGKEVRTILTDTSFYGRGVERVDWIDSSGNGRIIITAGELADLKNGPVHLQMFHEEDTRLSPGPARKGRLYLYYTLQREFMLQDSTAAR
jgi:hypothetical protein